MRVLRKSARSVAVIEASISSILADVRPLLRIEHCSLDLVDFAAESGLVTLSIGGACPHCEVSPATFSTAIAAHLRLRVPEVNDVSLVTARRQSAS